MHTTRFLPMLYLVAALSLTSTARAQDTRLAAMREATRELAARATSVRARAERADPRVRRESERILGIVEEKGASIAVRLDLIELLGRDDPIEESTIHEIESAYRSAHTLLRTVEAWYAAH